MRVHVKADGHADEGRLRINARMEYATSSRQRTNLQVMFDAFHADGPPVRLQFPRVAAVTRKFTWRVRIHTEHCTSIRSLPTYIFEISHLVRGKLNQRHQRYSHSDVDFHGRGNTAVFRTRDIHFVLSIKKLSVAPSYYTFPLKVGI